MLQVGRGVFASDPEPGVRRTMGNRARDTPERIRDSEAYCYLPDGASHVWAAHSTRVGRKISQFLTSRGKKWGLSSRF